MAMWNLLGSRPVEVLSWEVFGKDWKKDVEEQLKLSDKEIFEPAKILNQSIRRLNNLALYNIDIEINLDLSYKIGDAVFIDFKS